MFWKVSKLTVGYHKSVWWSNRRETTIMLPFFRSNAPFHHWQTTVWRNGAQTILIAILTLKFLEETIHKIKLLTITHYLLKIISNESVQDTTKPGSVQFVGIGKYVEARKIALLLELQKKMRVLLKLAKKYEGTPLTCKKIWGYSSDLQKNMRVLLWLAKKNEGTPGSCKKNEGTPRSCKKIWGYSSMQQSDFFQ